MLAIEGLLLLQLPPAVAPLNVAVLPRHTVVAPVIGPAVGGPMTVTVFVAVSLPHELVTV